MEFYTDTTQKSDAGSSNVFAEGTGVVRTDDAMKAHANGRPYVLQQRLIMHQQLSTDWVSTVFVNGKEIARIGDIL